MVNHRLDEVLGVTVGVVARLLTVGLCHYLCVAFGVENFPRIAESEYLLDVHPLREPR